MTHNIYNVDGTKRPAPDADKIRLGQRTEGAEARTGEPDPRRIAAEKAVECLRSATSWDEARSFCDRANLTLHITDIRGIDDKVRWGGYIKDDLGRKVNLSALPKDCSYKNLDARFEGKTTKAPSSKALTANSAKYHARQIFNGATSFGEAEKLLAGKGLSIERQGKTGGYLRFAEGEEGRIKLSALGGKYSLSSLSKKYADTDHILSSNCASSIHGNHLSVNNDAQARAESRVSSAQERAASTAAEGVQARTLSEALDDAFAQATALDALRKAKSVAAEAEQRAQEAEARARIAEKALITTKTEDTEMIHAPEKPKPQPSPEPSKASMHIDVSAPQNSNPASVHPQAEQPLKTEKPVEPAPVLTLAERIAEGRAKGVFAQQNKPLTTGTAAPQRPGQTANQAPKM